MPLLSSVRFRCLLLLSIVLSAPPLPLVGQVTGRLSGTAQDPSGRGIPGARVVLYLAGSDVEDAATTTDNSGGFLFSALRPTFYDVSVEAPNFKLQSVKNLKIDPLAETTLPPMAMQLGDNKTVVESQAPAQTLNTTQGQVSESISVQQVLKLPLFQRDPLRLLDTLASVSSNGRTGVRVINGQPATFSNITFDGINIQNSFIRPSALNRTSLALRSDQISEVAIVSVNPSSAYSGGSTQVAFAAPSGTNTFHGRAYWNILPSGLAAQRWLANRYNLPDDNKYQQFGGGVSGPVWKNKLTFYANYEALLDRSEGTTIGRVPASRLTSQDSELSRVLALFPAANANFILRDTGGFERRPYNYRGKQNSHQTDHLALGRLDFTPWRNHALGVTYSLLNRTLDDGGSPLPQTPNNYVDNLTNFYSVSWRWTPNARITNEARLGANLPSVDFRNRMRSQFGYVIQMNTQFSWLFPNRPNPVVFTNPLGGYTNPMAGIDPQGRNDHVYNYQDNVTINLGRHSMQAGFSLQSYRLDSYGISKGDAYSFQVPRYWVGNLRTGELDGIAQAYVLTGSSLNYRTGVTPREKVATDLWSGYFQDNWKVKPGLTLNLGVRYDYLSPAEEKTGTAILAVVGGDVFKSLYDPDLKFAFVSGNTGRRQYNADRNNISPYFGFAWQPYAKRNLVARGAYSISYVNDDLLRTIGYYSGDSVFQSRDLSLLTAASLQEKPTISGSLPLPDSLALSSRVQGADAINPNLRTPYLQQWNLGLEGELAGFVIGGRYVGNRLVGGLRGIDVNQITLPRDYLAIYNNLTVFTDLYGANAATAARDLYRELGTAFGYNFFANPNAPNGIRLLTNEGRSRYDAMQLLISRRVNRGLNFNANYTFAKATSNRNDYSQGAYDPYLDIRNRQQAWAISPYDLRHAFKATWIYDLPMGRGTRFTGGSLSPLLSNWSISGIAIIQSGAPFSIMSGLETSVIGLAAELRNTAVSKISSEKLSAGLALRSDGNGLSFVNLPAGTFVNPEPGQNGNLKLRAFTGPGQTSWDAGVRKTIAIGEGKNVEFRADFFNILNSANWVVRDQNINNTVDRLFLGNAAFGRDLSQSNTPRRIQFALRYTF
jgi:hypothetical protein